MEHFPRVTPIEPTLLLEFCVDSNYKCRLETQGSLLMPPDYNIGLTDWERFVRLKYALRLFSAQASTPLSNMWAPLNALRRACHWLSAVKFAACACNS